MSVEEIVKDVIDNAQKTGDTATQAAVRYSDYALSASQGFFGSGPVPIVRDVSVEIPPFSPQGQVLDLTAEYNRAFDEALDDFLPKFRGTVKDFIDDWFPSFNHCLKNQVEPWICATIQSGGICMPAYVEEQIYDRAHERDLKESHRLRSEALDSFAAMGGYSMPSGLLFRAVSQINQDAADKAAEHSRDVAIDQNKLRLDMLKFAVQQGAQMRLGIVQALTAYVQAWSHTIDSAIDKAKGCIDARARLWNAIESYYRAVVAAAELPLRRDAILGEFIVNKQRIDMDGFSASLQTTAKAAESAALAVAKIAAAAQSAQGTLSQLDHTAFESV